MILLMSKVEFTRLFSKTKNLEGLKRQLVAFKKILVYESSLSSLRLTQFFTADIMKFLSLSRTSRERL